MRLPSYQDLSKEQDRINNLPLDGSYLVAGPPGTGKTVMALYRSQMLFKRGANVRLLMYSRLLSQYTLAAIAELGIGGAVSTFHSWFYRFYQRSFHKRAPQLAPYVFDWPQVLTDVNLAPPPAGSLPYLLIDEGQDLPESFYMVAQYLARNVTVFADENQRLTEDNSTFEAIQLRAGITERHELRRNYRNSREIASLAADFRTGLSTGVPDLPVRTGERPRLLKTASLDETVTFISRYERNRSDLEIGVLVPTKVLREKFEDRLKGKTENPVQSYIGGQGSRGVPLNFESPGIRIVTYASAKGLEFDTVFLPELQTLGDDPDTAEFKMRFYVLVSRARDELFLMFSGTEEPEVLDAFPRDLVEWP